MSSKKNSTGSKKSLPVRVAASTTPAPVPSSSVASNTSAAAVSVSKSSGTKRKLSSGETRQLVSDTSSDEDDFDLAEKTRRKSTVLSYSSSEDDDDEQEEVEEDEATDVEGDGGEFVVDEEIAQLTGGASFTWNRVSHPPHRHMFTGRPGVRVPLQDPDDPLEIFNRFVTDEMIDNIVVETNRRARQKMDTSEKNINFTML